MIRRISTLSLAIKIELLLAVILLLVAVLVVWRSEAVLERAMLDQTQRQAELYLKLLEKKLQDDGSPLDKPRAQRVLEEESLGLDPARTFSIQGLYLYDVNGTIYAAVGDTTPPSRDLGGYYGEVLRRDQTYLGDEIEERQESHAEVTDIIVPLHQEGRVVGAIEMDLNLHKTVAIIDQLNSDYEWEILLVVVGVIMLALLLIGGVSRRHLLRPITELNEVARRIGSGDLKARSRWRGGDELGKLAESINGMAWSIDYLFDEQEQAHLQMLKSLEMALEAKDSYTASHSTRVARYAVMLGQRIGLERDELRLLKQGAIVHDLGKIGIADSILNKQGRLSDEEYEVMRGHPEMTATIMQPLRRFKGFVDIAKSHHERWDGRGYPDGLKGEEIPLLARIVAIADTWDAMTGNRVYRPGMTVDKALRILEQERDSGQWDPQLLEQFIAMVRDMQQAHHAVEADIFFAELDGLGDQPVAKSG